MNFHHTDIPDDVLILTIQDTTGRTLLENHSLTVRWPALDALDEDRPYPVSINVEGTFSSTIWRRLWRRS